MTSIAVSKPTPFPPVRAPRRLLSLLPDLVLSVLLPLALYHRFSPVLGEMRALLLASAPPLVAALAALLRHRRADALALLSLCGILLSVLAACLGGSPRLLLLREHLVSVGIGAAFLASVALRRPLVFFLAHALAARRSPEAAAAFAARRGRPAFRRLMARMTLVWGVGLSCSAGLACLCAVLLPPAATLAVAPVLSWGTIGALGLWTAGARRRAEQAAGPGPESQNRSVTVLAASSRASVV